MVRQRMAKSDGRRKRFTRVSAIVPMVDASGGLKMRVTMVFAGGEHNNRNAHDYK